MLSKRGFAEQAVRLKSAAWRRCTPVACLGGQGRAVRVGGQPAPQALTGAISIASPLLPKLTYRIALCAFLRFLEKSDELPSPPQATDLVQASLEPFTSGCQAGARARAGRKAGVIIALSLPSQSGAF